MINKSLAFLLLFICILCFVQIVSYFLDAKYVYGCLGLMEAGLNIVF